MLNNTSFYTYSNLCVSEVIGVGRKVYEYLIELHTGVVVKIMINGETLAGVEDFFRRRFTVKLTGRQLKTGHVLNVAQDYYKYSYSNCPFNSVICRRVY